MFSYCRVEYIMTVFLMLLYSLDLVTPAAAGCWSRLVSKRVVLPLYPLCPIYFPTPPKCTSSPLPLHNKDQDPATTAAVGIFLVAAACELHSRSLKG